jgi:hypothetical protein
VSVEQRFDFTAKIGVTSAGLSKKALALFEAEIERAAIDYLDLLPPIRVHHSPLLSSR